MSGEGAPYIIDASVTAKTPSDGNRVDLTIRWTLGAAKPNLVQVYALFGASAGNLLDGPNLVATENAFIRTPVGVTVTGANRTPFLFVALAPRLVEGGTVADEMPDATGEPQKWESFATQIGLPITYVNAPPSTSLSPPTLQAQSFFKTLNAGDRLQVQARAGGADNYHLIVNVDGSDEPQREDGGGNFTVASVPGKFYALKAQQRGKNFGGDPWSPWCAPLTIQAVKRTTSLKTFLAASGVLGPRTFVRPYAKGGSVRAMMGL